MLNITQNILSPFNSSLKLINCYHYPTLWYSLLGATACVKLNLFEEAVTWCSEGLDVSFNLVESCVFEYCSSLSLEITSKVFHPVVLSVLSFLLLSPVINVEQME